MKPHLTLPSHRITAMRTFYNIQALIVGDWESLKTDGSFMRFRAGTSQLLRPKSFPSQRAAVKHAQTLAGNYSAVRVMEYTAPPEGSRIWGQTEVWTTATPTA